MTNTNNWYNNVNGIQSYVHNLRDFNRLLNARREAACVVIVGEDGRESKRRESVLDEFIVGGRWLLDSYGQVGWIDQNSVRAPERLGYARANLSQLTATMKVLTHEDFINYIGGVGSNFTWSIGGGKSVPHGGAICPHCKQEITMLESGDVVVKHGDHTFKGSGYVSMTLAEVRQALDETITDGVRRYQVPYQLVRNDAWIDLTPDPKYIDRPMNEFGWAEAENSGATPPYPVKIDFDNYRVQRGDELHIKTTAFYHERCMVDMLTGEFRTKAIQAINDAGFEVTGSVSIPNEYGSSIYHGLWLLVETKQGLFKVGWRKRVIHAERMVEAASEPDSVAFKEVDSSKYIHANNYEHLTQLFKETFSPK